MPVSGVGATEAGDCFDFALRDRLPGRGLPLAGLPEPLAEFLDEMNGWTRDVLAARDWALRLKTLRNLIPRPEVADSISPAQFHIWISTARALDALDAALDQTAALATGGRIALGEFWRHAEAAIELTDLRLPDRRRDVVHVLDVFEARQWELPIVFVCGMIERHFPQYHREDALLDDSARRRAGLKTSAESQREERSLFDLAITRATEMVILSYPRFDDSGDATLPSFFLDGNPVSPVDGARILPRPLRENAPPAVVSVIQDPALRQRITEKNRTLSPSAIESFLQCPFQLFARKTLRLRPRPPAPRDRLDALLQGTIIHAAIAQLERMPLLGAAVLDSVFEEEAARHRIPSVYRTEAVRLEMLRNFSLWLADRRTGLDWKARVEEQFEIALTPELSIRGRIDRLEVGPNGEAVVIDYKYSAANAIKQKVKSQEAGEVVQAGLYLLAASKQFGLTPAGMLYCGLRKDVEWGGWHVPLAGLEIGESCTRDRLGELISEAAAKASAVFEAICSGTIEAKPAEEKKCSWCDYRDICRFETQ
jgi:RecB family exonuclease